MSLKSRLMLSVFIAATTLTLLIRILMPKTSVYHGPKSDHFDGEHFSNQDPDIRMHGFSQFWKWQRTRTPAKWPTFIENPGSEHPPQRVDGLRLTYLNHASVLVQFGGLNFITDPIWSERCSPFTWIGPKRHRAPGMKLEDLPPIDAVLISHNHYDHMDFATLNRLESKFHPKFFTSLGNQELLLSENLTDVTEMDWWQTIRLNDDLSITYVPSKHFSARSINDRNRTLWGGFVVTSKKMGSFYFAGDTGYGIHFEQIAERFPKILLSLLPIGAYEPQWFLREMHMNPQDAVNAHQALRSEFSLAIHWGVFHLTDEAIDAPLKALELAKKSAGLGSESFIALEPGLSWQVSLTPAAEEKRMAR